MAFWGLIVKPGSKPSPYVPLPEGGRLHVSQAALGLNAVEGKKSSLVVSTEDSPKVVICTLKEGGQESISLDLIFSHYTEFTVEGSSPIHLSGYIMIEEEEEDDEEAFNERMLALQQMEDEMGIDDDDDSEDDSEGDEDDSEGDEDDSDEEMDLGAKKPTVVIEEITDEEAAEAQNQAKGKRKADKQAAAPPSKKRAGEAAPVAEPKKEQPQQTKQAKQEPEKKPAQQAKQAQQQPEAAKSPKPAAAASPAAAPPAKGGKAKVRRYENGFEIEDVAMGRPDGKLAKAGKRVFVQYKGRLQKNGKVFDQTKGKPFAFRLGVGEVIAGWDKGVEGMRVGDKRKLTIPASMGYGAKGAGKDIPGNATLIFDVELVDVK